MTTLCSGNWLEQFDQLSPSSPPGISLATDDDGLRGGTKSGTVRSKSRLVSKPIARMRKELYGRLGVVDSRACAPEKVWLPVRSLPTHDAEEEVPEEVSEGEAAGVRVESRLAKVPVDCVLRVVEVVGAGRGGAGTDEQRERRKSCGSSSSSFLSSTSTLAAASYTGLSLFSLKSPIPAHGPASPTVSSPTSPISPGSEGSRLSFERRLDVEDFDFADNTEGLYLSVVTSEGHHTPR